MSSSKFEHQLLTISVAEPDPYNNELIFRIQIRTVTN